MPVWDCFDPFDDETVIRVTFMDGLLLVWGVPAADPPVYRVRVPVFRTWPGVGHAVNVRGSG